MKYFFLLCLFLLSPVHAEIYKGVDAKGNTVYSDENTENNKAIPKPTDNVIQMPKLILINASDKEEEEEEGYVYLNIDEPVNDGIQRNNLGIISVQFSIKPALRTKDGDYIVLYLDSKEVIIPEETSDTNKQIITLGAKPKNHKISSEKKKDNQGSKPGSVKMTLPLNNIDRGLHTVYVEVRNKDKAVLITSNFVSFHMKRHSIQHNKAFGSSIGPTDSNGRPYAPGPQGIIFKPGPVIPPSQ